MNFDRIRGALVWAFNDFMRGDGFGFVVARSAAPSEPTPADVEKAKARISEDNALIVGDAALYGRELPRIATSHSAPHATVRPEMVRKFF